MLNFVLMNLPLLDINLLYYTCFGGLKLKKNLSPIFNQNNTGIFGGSFFLREKQFDSPLPLHISGGTNPALLQLNTVFKQRILSKLKLKTAEIICHRLMTLSSL